MLEGSRAQRVAGLCPSPLGTGQGAEQDRTWLWLCQALAQPLGSGTLSQALAGWVSRSFFLWLFQAQEQLVKVWTNESLQVLDVLAALCHPASHSVLLP